MKVIFSNILVLLFLTGCVEQLTPQKEGPQKPTLNDLEDVSYQVDKKGDTKLVKKYVSVDKKTKKQKVTYSYERVPKFDNGYSKTLSLKNKREKEVYVKGDKVKVSVESIPMNEFIDLIFGSVLKMNYAMNADVKKMKNLLTLNMQQAQSSSDMYKVVKKILSINGVSIKNENGVLFLYKINNKNLSEASDIFISYGRSIPNSVDDNKEVMAFVPYNYVSPISTSNLIKQAGLKKIRFFYSVNGIQTMKGKAADIRKALELVNLIDRPFLSGKTPYLIQLENINVLKFTKQIKKIFELNNIKVVSSPSKGGIVLLPLEELNKLYVITPKKEWLKMILYWKDKLDVNSAVTQKPRLYIYKVKNRKADELAKAINIVLGLSKKSVKTDVEKIKNVAGTTQENKVKVTKSEAPSNSFLIDRLDYVPTVTADLDTNILMLKLAPEHYKVLLPFIEELDQLPLQTLVEVTVAEVTMTDTFSLGFEYAISNQSAGLEKSLLNITGGGSGLGIVFKSNYIDATVNALAEKQLLNIVSKPKVLILNNTTGNINVGTQVPIITSETSASDIATAVPTINRNITYRTTGINLGLTPTINSNGVLTMKISISLSEAQLNDTSGIDSPLIVNRTLSTVAVINSGDTILIGGLISKNKSASKGGIPVLKDIPYIGAMFAQQSDKTTKTELIMLIRPIIIETPTQIKEETNNFKTLMQYIKMSEL